MRALGRPRFWFTLVAVWFSLLFWLSSQSRLRPPGPEFEGNDKVLHVVYFALGGILFFHALRLKTPARSRLSAALLTILFCAAVGAFDEWHQTFTPNRSGNDPFDWMADSAGGVLGALAGGRLIRFLPKRESC